MIESYNEVKVVLAPSGELLLALPIYANQTGALFNGDDLVSFTADTTLNKCSLGIYESMGYLIHHPAEAFCFYMKSLDLFEDLGAL